MKKAGLLGISVCLLVSVFSFAQDLSGIEEEPYVLEGRDKAEAILQAYKHMVQSGFDEELIQAVRLRAQELAGDDAELLAFLVEADVKPDGSEARLTIGDKAPKLDVSEWIQGYPVEVGADDTIYVIEFWATWCPPCRHTIPHLNQLHIQYEDKGVVIVGISDEDKGTVQPFVEEHEEMTYRVALDNNSATWNAYCEPFDVQGIPHAFLVDKTGNLVWHGHPMDGLDEALETLLKGDSIDMTHQMNVQKIEQMTGLYEFFHAPMDEPGLVSLFETKILDLIDDDVDMLCQFGFLVYRTHEDTQRPLELFRLAQTMADKEDWMPFYFEGLMLHEDGMIEEAKEAVAKAIERTQNEDILLGLRSVVAEW